MHSFEQGLSQKQLCQYFGWDYKTIATEAKRQKLATHDYLKQKTGWMLKKERYYPPALPDFQLVELDDATEK